MGDSRIRMSLLDLMGLVVVAVLVMFLCRKHEERMYRHPPENQILGQSFDAASVCDRVARVRRDYLAVVGARSRGRSCRDRLHAEACRTVRGRSYFRQATNLAAREDNVLQGRG